LRKSVNGKDAASCMGEKGPDAMMAGAWKMRLSRLTPLA